MTMPPGIAYMDGRFMPMEEAKISVLDWGFLRSDATYDVVHAWQGRFFRLDAHMDRFLASAERLRLALPVARGELERILAECTARAGHQDAYVEMVLTRGMSPSFSRDPRDAENRLICFAIPFSWIVKPERREQGLSVALSANTRIPPEAVDPRTKNYHWLDFVMGLLDAYDRGADNVVMRDRDDNLTEGPGFNVFVVKQGHIATPDRGMLEGITRRSAIELARELEIPLAERTVAASELAQADEAFLTSTAGGIIPITTFNGQPVANGQMGPITKRLIDAYWAKHTDPAWSIGVEEILAREAAA